MVKNKSWKKNILKNIVIFNKSFFVNLRSHKILIKQMKFSSYDFNKYKYFSMRIWSSIQNWIIPYFTIENW